MQARTERVVFWDFDGTLAHREGPWSATLLSALRLVAPGLDVTVEALRPELSIGLPWRSPDEIVPPRTPAEWWSAQRPLFRKAFARAGVPDAIAECAVEEIPTEYYRPSAWTVAADAEAALRVTGAAGYRNAILSNHAPELPILVDALGLGALVDRTITSAAVGAEKPNPRIFRYALDAMNAGPDVWMVGDNPVADVQGAEAVGIRAILVTPRHDLASAAARIAAGGTSPTSPTR